MAALAVEHLGAGRGLEGARRTELSDLAPADGHIVGRADPGARVEHVGAADQQVRGRAVADDERRVRLAAVGLGERHHASCGAGVDSAGGGAARPTRSSYSTAMRTTTPAATCWPMTACGESITSAASSTPRFTGPGCMSTWRALRRRPSIWYWAAYSRMRGTKESVMRSFCIRSAYTTSASPRRPRS